MATVERDTTRTRTPYVVRWRDEAGKQRKRGFGRKVDADRWRSEVEHKLNTGSYIDPQAGRRTFRDYAEAWRLSQPHRANTAARTRSQFDRHVYPVLGDRPIAGIRPSEVQAFVAGLSTTLAPGSVRTVFSSTRAVFAAAVRDRAIAYDPCDRIKLPEVHRERITPLDVEQVDALAEAMPAAYRALVVVVAGTGVRQGEAFGIEARDVDFLRKTVSVERQVQPAAGGGYVVTPPKNRASIRTIPIGQVVVDELAAHLAAYPAKGEQFVFRASDGGPCTRNVFNASVWRPAVKRAGLPAIGMHQLRHWYASVLIAAGHNPKAVAERLGHSNAAMTLNTYSHLFPADEDRTRQALDAVFRRDVPTMCPPAEAGR